MFTRKSLVNTMIVKNKNNRKTYMKSLSLFELQTLVKTTYTEFKNNKSIDKIFQEKAIAKKHKTEYKELLLNYFIKNELKYHILPDDNDLNFLSNITKLFKNYDFGFIYVLKINDKIKIGKTTNITKRLSAYKSHIGYYPEFLQLIFHINHSKIEKELIDKCAKFQYTKEWLKLESIDLINEYINDILP